MNGRMRKEIPYIHYSLYIDAENARAHLAIDETKTLAHQIPTL